MENVTTGQKRNSRKTEKIFEVLSQTFFADHLKNVWNEVLRKITNLLDWSQTRHGIFFQCCFATMLTPARTQSTIEMRAPT